jgi:hypothetical protein
VSAASRCIEREPRDAQLLDPKWEAPAHIGIDDTPTSFLQDFGKAAYSFALGGVAGATGATAVYPIDLVRARSRQLHGLFSSDSSGQNANAKSTDTSCWRVALQEFDRLCKEDLQKRGVVGFL